MKSTSVRRRCLIAFAMLLTSPVLAFAQGTSGIAGVVKDPSGAVLPGVTVEAASPALIEKVRTVVTDNEGQYKVVDLRPGVYSVTFTLPGFNTVKREGIELTASFTASVNADLRVGAIEETVTVSGAAPTVDVNNVVQERVLTRDVINAIPVGNKNVSSLAVLVPGMVTTSQDVGGTAYGSASVAIHGGRTTEMQHLYDGMYFNNGAGTGGAYPSIALNDATIQEVSTETGALSAESWMGSVRNNSIPKDGGNTFRGYFFGAFTNQSFQSSNLTSDLVARGLLSVDTARLIWDVDPALGGPLIKDKLWFYGSYRTWLTKYTIAGLYYNASPVPQVYTPDIGQPAFEGDRDSNTSLRLTWQLSPRNKIVIHPQNNQQYRDHFYSSSTARVNNPDATIYYLSRPSLFGMITWTSPVTNRLLLEAGTGFGSKDYQFQFQPSIGPLPYSYRELSTGISWGNIGTVIGNNASHNFTQKFTASYVTGSHAAKFGFQLQHGSAWTTQQTSGNEETLQLLNGLPRQVTVYALPLELREVTKYNLGLFAQDQWTIRHLTINVGGRFDHLNSYVPAESAGPGPQVPNRNISFAQVDNVPNWKTFSPRLGVSYDLFGDGKTAVKASLSRYVDAPYLISYTRVANPLAAIATNATRTWTDSNNDFIPQANELGALSNANFGNSVLTTQYAPDVPTTRGYSWETSFGIQRELMSGVSAGVAYFRRAYGNITLTQNTAVTSANFSPFCVPVPVDPQLPGGGGNQECGFFDVNPAQFGKVANVIQESSHFGSMQDVFDGVDLNMNARLPRGIVVSGGVSDGRERTNNCALLGDLSLSFAGSATGVTAPRTQAFCDIRPPFQPNVKFLAVYPLPWWGIQTSTTIQSLPGPQVTASYTATSAQVAPSLGRNLSSGAAGTVTVDLIPPGTQYGDRLNQVNLRVSKVFKPADGRRIQGIVDLYNMFNANPVLAQNTTYGSAWQRPIQVLQGRLVKFGLQLDF